MKKPLQFETAAIVFLICIGFLFRVYRFNNPVADWHSFRQADTASVTREYVKHGVDVLHPKYHDVSNIASGFDNPQGYRMVEFPILNALVAVVVRVSNFDLVAVSRLLSISASLGAGFYLYRLVRRWSGKAVALVSLAVFATLPYSVFYGRVILPEPGLLFFSTAALSYWDLWLQKGKSSHYWFSLFSLAMALLLKPFALFLAPVFFVLLVLNKPKKWYRTVSVYLYALLALIPLIAWRKWISQFPEGIPVSNWLFNEDGIRLRPAWFRWLFLERYTKLIGGYIGLPLSFINLTAMRFPELYVYAAWWAGILGYFVVIATGNVRHDYYQVMAIPIFCITFARGIVLSARWLAKQYNAIAAKVNVATIPAVYLFGFFCAALYLPMWLFAAKHVHGYFNVNHWEYVRAGQAVQKHAAPNDLVIAPAFGDTVFLLQTDRRGWPIGFDMPTKISKGAAWYVSTSYDDEARQLEQQYTTVEKTDEYILINLRQQKKY